MIVEDEKIAGKIISENLKKKGFEVILFENGEEALLGFKQNPIDLILMDYKLPGISGEECFIKVKEINPFTPVIFMTAYSSVEKAVRLLKMGAYTYITKPIEMDELFHNIKNALEKITLQRENLRLQEDLKDKFSFENHIFDSPNMQEVINTVLRAAKSSANILISGESGTGKEVIANITHLYSQRKNNKFIKINLSAFPSTLIEAELFGAEKGAFTDSVQTRIGKFEDANNGTIFLDEIGELSPDLQVKLLRTIQEREITRLGSNTPIKIDLRLISASNQNLQELILKKQFREDLFFRLNVINIHLPPLRERKEDIKPMIDLFIKKYNKKEGKKITSISKDALYNLIKYNYPGNIRELENIIERAVILTRNDIIKTDDLPVFLNSKPEKYSDSTITDSLLTLAEKIKIIEKQIILDTMKKHQFNQTKAGKELGISESGLRYKLKLLNIKRLF